MSSQTTSDLVSQLADQLDFHWTTLLRPRLDGLTDDEYFWCPVPNCWTAGRAVQAIFSTIYVTSRMTEAALASVSY